MFRPSGLFKSVPCPRVSTCGLQNCLFSHQAAVVLEQSTVIPTSTSISTSSSSSTSISSSSKVARNERSPTPPPPPKRRRIDEAHHIKSTEAPSNPIIKSILKKPTPSPSSLSSPPPHPPSSSPSQQPPSSSLDSEAGRYIKLKTTDKKTGTITKTRIERAGPSFSSSSALRSSGPSSTTTTQSLRNLHTSSSSKTTQPSDPDATKLLLDFGKPKPGPPREPERLVPRTVPRSPTSFENRHNILVQLHKEFIRLDPDSQKTVLGKQRMIKLANDEEAASALKDVNTYKVVMRNRIFALGKMTPADFKKEVEAKEKERRKNELPDGNEELITGLTPEAEVTALGGYVASMLSQKASDYVVLPPSDEEIKKTREGLEAADGREECDRCKTRFQVLKEQDQGTKSWVTGGSCTHHYGRFVVENGRKTWGCCATAPGENPGCVEHTNHVFMVKSPIRLASVWQFVDTPSAPILSPSSETPPPPDKNIEKAICMDCEMAFTTKGFEVIRLTATRFPTYEPIVDILVQPYGEILDLNTRFSGVTQEQFDTALPYSSSSLPNKDDPKILLRASSPLEARDILFTHIDSSTIIIGHSLDNDLKCMRIIHPRVVDTALLYRHRAPGMRFSLKHLVRVHLGRYIQSNENAEGHDSMEDANEAGNLVRKKIQNDVKVGKIGKDGIWAGDVMYTFRNAGENSGNNNKQDGVVPAAAAAKQEARIAAAQVN
ncbi:RNA exonuclease 3 [Arthrobotrys conoides]|uniref:RNA exonuclease 3 n=1 Tax=Arthrobotrys conoides TaxID=74498 RepID=A0AAN8RSG4_9PEZI